MISNMEEAVKKPVVEKAEIVNVEYERPKFVHRILANFIDILVFIFLLISTFIVSRLVVTSTSMYKNNYRAIQQANLNSGLFVNATQGDDVMTYKDGDEVKIVTTYMLSKNNLTYKDMCNRSHKRITFFFSYLKDIAGEEIAEKASKVYDEKRLALKGNVEGHEHYFELDELGNVYMPTDANDFPYYSYKNYFTKLYRPFIDDTLIDDYFVKYTPGYKSHLKNEAYYLLLLELPISFFSAVLLTYFVPPLFFRRGRKTLGKALYHIGMVDSRVLNVSFPRFLARFSIFFFGEMVLSIFTFGIPFFFSFTMMLTTKNKQGFPDYLLRINEIDTSKRKIYYDKYEIMSEKARQDKKAVDFRLPKSL